MTKIYVLIGKSGSGKDSFFEGLIEDTSLNLKKIIGYTTRPKRVHEENGREYFFIDEKELDNLRLEDKIIEERCYHTVHGDWYYLTVKDETIKEEKNSNTYLYIGTLESFVKMRDYYGEDVVIPLYIDVEDGIRLERALIRERKQTEPKYAEMCRRFLADCNDFSEDKIVEAGIEKRFDNSNTKEECLNMLKQYIKSQE